MMIKKDSVRSWVVIVLVGLALTIAHSDRTLLAIAAPTLVREQHISGTSLGILLSAFSWTYMFAQLPSGWLVDRFGPKAVLGFAFICWSIVCVATGFTTTFIFLLLCRLALGLFEAPLYAVAHSVMAQVFSDRRRALATAIYSKGVSLGPAVGALLGSFFLIKFGWSGMFIIFGLGSLVFLWPWLKFAPAKPAPPVQKEKVAQDNPALSGRKYEQIEWGTIKELLSNRAVLGTSLGYFGFLYLYYIYATWLPTYLAEARGLSTAEIAWMASVPFLIAIVAGPATGWFTDWLIGRGYSQTVVRKSAIAIGLLLGSAVVPAAFVSNSTEAAMLFLVALIGQSISAANMLALPSSIAPEGRAGLVGSFQQMMGALGGVVSPILTGVLYDYTNDFRVSILVAAGMLVFAGFCFLILLPRVERVTLGGSTVNSPTASATPRNDAGAA